jgi:ABC-type lipoprotein export system ATPase subunit
MLDVVREERATLIVTTHDPVVIELADRTMHMRDGKMVDQASAIAL